MPAQTLAHGAKSEQTRAKAVDLKGRSSGGCRSAKPKIRNIFKAIFEKYYRWEIECRENCAEAKEAETKG